MAGAGGCARWVKSQYKAGVGWYKVGLGLVLNRVRVGIEVRRFRVGIR